MNQIVHWNVFSNPIYPVNGVVAAPAGRALVLPDWEPAVDIIETDAAYVFKAEVPGLKKAQLDVWVEQRVLYLRGERKPEKDEAGVYYHRLERAHGIFMRSFELPEDADANAVSAQVEDGILTITASKAKQAKPGKIEIKVN